MTQDNRIVLPHQWKPRNYQLPLLRYMESGGLGDGQGKRAAVVWHRRSGKDTCAANWTAVAAMQRVGSYWHMLPEQTQARRAVWERINKDGTRLIDQVWPQELRTRVRNNEMTIDLVNGSIWQVLGSDRYNANVGANPIGVVFSEWSLTDPRAWDYVRPILRENNGWAMFIYTPRGANHGLEMLQTARENQDWYSEVLTVDDTGVVSKTEIEMERRSGMSWELIQQEYYCSFTAPNAGSYYGRLLEEARKDGRIARVPYDPNLAVHTWWDLGVNNHTSIWFSQSTNFEHRLIDHYEGSGEGLSHYAKVLTEKPYAYGGHHFPHDVQVKELGSGKSRVETLAELGITAQIVPNLPLEDGIEAVRGIIPICAFDAEKCAYGLKCLMSYHRKWDDKKRAFATHPDHDWSSDSSDSFRYFAVGSNQTRQYREPPRARRAGWLAA